MVYKIFDKRVRLEAIATSKAKEKFVKGLKIIFGQELK